MTSPIGEMTEIHWLFDTLNHIDLGLVIVDQNYKVTLWNSFMENHSGTSSSVARGKTLFSLFPDIDEEWLKRKLDNVIALRTSIFISWEQRAYLFPFKSYRPITGLAEFSMFALRFTMLRMLPVIKSPYHRPISNLSN